MSRILLVRHGESTWNAAGRWQGQADPPLSPRGERQAVAAVRAIEDRYTGVVASDLRRARRTGELLARGLGLGLRVEARLRERHAGPWEGLTRSEIDDRWPGMLEDGRRPDDYEPDDRLLARALEALDELEVPAIVITHGGVIRVIERALGVTTGRIPNLCALAIESTVHGYLPCARVDLVTDGGVATEAHGPGRA